MTFGDPFETFRTLLAIFLAVYALAYTLASLNALQRLLAGDQPQQRFLRRYVAYQLASIRLRPFRRELAGLSLWTAALALLWWAHAWI